MTLYYVYVAMLVHHNGVEAMRPSGIQNVIYFLNDSLRLINEIIFLRHHIHSQKLLKTKCSLNLNRCDICKNLIGVNELGFLHPVDFVTLAIPDIYTAAFSTGTYSNVLPVVVFGGK